MIVDDPATLAEVTAIFEAYETALLANDNETLEAMFLDLPENLDHHLFCMIPVLIRSNALFRPGGQKNLDFIEPEVLVN